MENTTNHEIKFLSQKFRAMQNLSKNTELPLPQHYSDRQLLENILRSNGESPIKLLEKNEQNLISRVLLWYALDNLKQFTHATQKTDIPLTALAKSYGYFAKFAPQHFEPLVGTHPTSIHADILYEVIYNLKQAMEYPLSLPSAAEPHRNTWLHLLHQLFLLPENVSPLEWIKTEKSDAALRSTLRHLLNEVIPSDSVWLSNDIEIYKINQTIQGNFLRMTLSSVIRKEQGFIINLEFPLPRQMYNDLNREGLYVSIYEEWQNITRIYDNHNQDYLVCKSLHKRQKHWLFWQKYHISLWCYPALSSNSNTIIVEIADASLKLIGVFLDYENGYHRNKTLYETSVDTFRWKVDLQ